MGKISEIIILGKDDIALVARGVSKDGGDGIEVFFPDYPGNTMAPDSAIAVTMFAFILSGEGDLADEARKYIANLFDRVMLENNNTGDSNGL